MTTHSNSDRPPNRKRFIKPVCLLGMVVFAIIAQQAGWVDFGHLHDALAAQAHQWWAPVVLIALKIFLYAFALPASTLILLAGSLYPPWAATAITVIGGTVGALGAYAVVRFLSAEFVARHAGQRSTRWLRDHAGFFSLCALRTLPGFPHSMLNYGAGLLRLPMPSFLASTVIGLTLKGYVYTAAVHAQVQAETTAERLSWNTLWPLVAWAALLAVGALWKHVTTQRNVA